MKICRSCSGEFEDSMSHCPSCLAVLETFEKSVPAPSTGNTDSASPNTPLSINRTPCLECGEDVPDGMLFCINGHRTARTAATDDSLPSVPMGDLPRPVLEYGGERCALYDGAVLGRLGDIRRDWFEPHLSISGRHCRILNIDGRWYVQRMDSAKNSLTLDGLLLKHGETRLITGSHGLGISNALVVKLSLEAL